MAAEDPWPTCDNCGSPIGFGHAMAVSRLRWDGDRARMLTGCSECPRCSECGATMQLSHGPGRLRSYRGQDGYEIPEALEFWACGVCSAEWMTGEQIDQLSDAFEAERARRASR